MGNVTCFCSKMYSLSSGFLETQCIYMAHKSVFVLESGVYPTLLALPEAGPLLCRTTVDDLTIAGLVRRNKER